MRIVEAEKRTEQLMEQLLEIWEASVRATHRFLSEEEIENIRKYVPRALEKTARLFVAEDGAGRPVGFMGIEGQSLEMLFLAPEARGKGLGKQLVRYGINSFGVRNVTVNEQNPQAVGFYEHMGFRLVRRTDHDEQGNPYPLLYMSFPEA